MEHVSYLTDDSHQSHFFFLLFKTQDYKTVQTLVKQELQYILYLKQEIFIV